MGPVKIRPEELAALVRSRQRLNTLVFWAGSIGLSAVAAAFLYNVYSAGQPWIRFGQAWAFGVLAFVFATEFERGAGRIHPGESCVRFLERQHDERGRGYLRIRRRLPLLLPSIAASWLGGGPAIVARARGLDPSSRLFRFCAGPWPFLLTGAALVCVWWAFGLAAGKANRDRDEIRRAVALE
ncbi:MAG TPA: hypothetical protein VMH81_01695 [Bryobacteraceae bacterium]|nr:hypothetical protein [Bryobacteraceae bacterium]